MVLKGVASIVAGIAVTASVLGAAYWYIFHYATEPSVEVSDESHYQEVHEGGKGSVSSWLASLSFKDADAKNYPATELRVKID